MQIEQSLSWSLRFLNLKMVISAMIAVSAFNTQSTKLGAVLPAAPVASAPIKNSFSPLVIVVEVVKVKIPKKIAAINK